MKKYMFIILLFIASPAHAQRISDLPPASTLTGNEFTVVVQNGVTKRSTVSQFLTGSFILGIPSGGTGLGTIGPSGTCLQSNGVGLIYAACGSGPAPPTQNAIIEENGPEIQEENGPTIIEE